MRILGSKYHIMIYHIAQFPTCTTFAYDNGREETKDEREEAGKQNNRWVGLSRPTESGEELAGRFSDCAITQHVPGYWWNASSGEGRMFFIWIPHLHSLWCWFTCYSFRKRSTFFVLCWKLPTIKISQILFLGISRTFLCIDATM